MRIVAGFLLAALLAASLSAPVSAERLHANDECDNDVTPGAAGGNSCLRVPLAQVPEAGRAKTGEYLFLWLGAVDCTTGPVCVTTERPPAPNVVTGQPAIYGLLYVDSNGFSGLQRIARNIGGTNYPGDAVALV